MVGELGQVPGVIKGQQACLTELPSNWCLRQQSITSINEIIHVSTQSPVRRVGQNGQRWVGQVAEDSENRHAGDLGALSSGPSLVPKQEGRAAV